MNAIVNFVAELLEDVLKARTEIRSIARRLSLQTVAISRMNARLRRIERLERDRSTFN